MNIDIIIFLLFINTISFFICAFDKYLAKKRKFRISEKILIGLCFCGGFAGFLLSSRIFRHKTKDKKVLIFVYLASIVWILLLIYISI